MSLRNAEASPRVLTIWAGVLLLVSAVAGAYGEMVVPGRLVVAGDAAATAGRIQASGQLFRLGFASYLVEAICDVALTGIFYVLLKRVRRDLAFTTACFRLVSTSTFAIAAFFYFAASVVLGMKTFPPDQANALALLFMKLYGVGGGIFMVFYGVAALTLGTLIHRSTFLPKPLGVLLMLAGLGFVVRNFLQVLAPAYASDLLLAPMGLGMVSLGLWLLIKGVDPRGWEAQTLHT